MASTSHVFPLPASGRRIVMAGILAAALFLLIGMAILPYPGLQNDECLFVQPLYSPIAPEFKIRVFHHDQAIMLMTYLGTLKTWLYAAIFALWQPSVWSVRVPALLCGACTILLFTLLLKRICGSFGAICGAFLLALDPSYLLTSVFDWGPVAFQHLLLAATLLAFHSFWRAKSSWALGAGFLFVGLAMWDKALFSWTLGGMVVAVILLFGKEIWGLLTVRRVVIATVAFVVGSWPFLLYNVRAQGETFRGSAKLSVAEILPKSTLLWATLDGYGLFGYLSFEREDKAPLEPKTGLERASAAIREAAGYHRKNGVSWVLAVVLLAVPLWKKRWKVMMFAFITCTVSWVLMASTKGAGGSVHHVVLIWPLPQLMLATGLAGAAEYGKWLSGIATLGVVLICGQGFLILNQTFYDLVRHGEGEAWSDAIRPLYDKIEQLHPAHVNMMDWGFEYNLMTLSQGKMPLRWGGEPGEHEVATENDRVLLKAFLEDPDSIWIQRKTPIEVSPGTIERYLRRAQELGYRQEMLDTIRDRNGRDVFTIYRYLRAPVLKEPAS